MQNIKYCNKNVFFDIIISLFYKIKTIFYKNNNNKKKKIEDKELFTFFHSLYLFFETYNDIVLAFNYSITCINNKEFFYSIIEDLKKGIMLSTVLNNSGYFSSDIIFIIKSGEKNNTLLQSFAMVEKILKIKMDKKKELKRVIIYPFVVFVLFFIVLLGFSCYVLPSLISLVGEINSKFLDEMKYLNFFITLIKFLLVIFAFLFFILLFLFHYKNEVFFSLAIKTKIFRSFFLNYYLFCICYSLSLSIKNNINLVDAFDLLVESIDIGFLKKNLIKIKKEIQKGLLLSVILNKYNILNKNFIDIIKSGEKVGKLTDSIELCARICEEQYNDYVNNFINLLPIILALVISFLLIVFIYLLFLPIYSLGV